MMRRYGIRAALRRRPGGRWWLFVICLWVLVLTCWRGCTPQERYRILSFFLDGVPDPNAPVERKSPSEGVSMIPAGGVPSKPKVVYYAHKPFAEEKCNACHKPSAGLVIPATGGSICATCHKGISTEYAVMHGPVASGACTFCHTAHESTVPHLLQLKPSKLCVQCHVRGDEMLVDTPPAHRDTGRNCLDCHMGHGGDSRPFLRDNRLPAASQPATSPASQPASGPASGESP